MRSEVEDMFGAQPAIIPGTGLWIQQANEVITEMKENFWDDWEEFKTLYPVEIATNTPESVVLAFLRWQYKKYGGLMGYV